MKNIFYFFILIFLFGCSSIKQPNNDFNNQSNVTTSTSQTYIVGGLSENQKQEVVLFSLNLLEKKYKYGGKNPDFGIDCSGLITFVFKKSIGISLKGSAFDIASNYGNTVPINELSKLEPGDLIFFNTTGKKFSHVGLYIGNNKFIHASSAKSGVVINNIYDKYYFNRIEEIKRI